ncbi:Gfo/Idh/MocA family protein [Arthrobacter sp. A2-55]|uniref:Gfo/Idh/MocA family protein n=1 Tax=Arthrobacter sp. A2-55 TaxID=2897337 RepID=UPI0021CD3BC8|nr:Gfo/Idh/MocA family oxidoreductase [Arthrobacter sp. A2-55]MCU6480270.1 Gfo/Idh/MocA family oxidoreductase [Arthrobacter sp. A2-55]
MTTDDFAERTLKVGVVGLGWAGQQHPAAFSALDGVDVVALAGMEADVLAELADTFQVPHAFATWQELLELEGLDAVSIAVPTFLHAPIAVAALERGLHVLSEKPLARNGAEGAAMVAAARQAGRVLDVVFNHRRRGDVRKLKEIIDGGGLGRPYYAKASWLRRRGIPTLGSWFTNPELSGGGPLADIGVHVLDYALHLLGEPKVISVSASAYAELGPQGRGGDVNYLAAASEHKFEVEDFASAFIRLEGGVTLVLEAGWASYRDPADLMDFRVYGTDGGAELRAAQSQSISDAGLHVFTDVDGMNADYVAEVPEDGNHRAVVEDFVAAIRSGSENWGRHDGSVALTRALVIDACYLSAREQREVEL